jgi:uncharacterized membrane protein
MVIYMYNEFAMVEEKTSTPAAENSQTQETKTEEAPPIKPEKELFSWRAPARPFKKRDREYWMTIMAIAGLVGLIVFIAEGAMPVILIIAVIFLYYVLSTVEPEEIEYKVTNFGIKIVDRRTEWELLTRFWFTQRFNNHLIVFEMLVMPGRLELVINPEDREKLTKVISGYIPEEEAPPTNLDRASNWFARKLPGN